MPTFFRKIRQKLLSKNRVPRYLAYAAGEILLVVIGILIALQINNWNEEKKLQEQETKLLVSLQTEVEENIAILARKVKANEAIMANMDSFLELGDQKTDLEYNYATYSRIFDYSPAIVYTPVLNDLLESDSKVLISRSNLLPVLRALRFNYMAIEKGEFYLDEFWNDKVTDYIISKGTGHSIFSGNPDNAMESKLQQEKRIKIDNQLLSLIAVKKGLQRPWLQSQIRSLERSRKVLLLLKDNSAPSD
jgi:hypothetical protein